MHRPDQPRNRRGMTLVEVLLAASIAAVVGLAALGLLRTTAGWWAAAAQGDGSGDARRSISARNAMDRQIARALKIGHASGVGGPDGRRAFLALWSADDFLAGPGDEVIQAAELTIFEVAPDLGRLRVWTPRPWDSLGEDDQERLAENFASGFGEAEAIAELIDGGAFAATDLYGGEATAAQVIGGGFLAVRDAAGEARSVKYAVRTDAAGTAGTLAGTVVRRD